MSRAARQKPVSDPILDGRPDPHMHSGKCSICRHPRRAEIERAFIDWVSPREIARAFGLAGHATVYRHAHARGLFDHRRRNLLIGLGRIAEHVAEIEPSATNVLAAFIAMAKIDARGDWSTGHRFNLVEAHDRSTWDLACTMERDGVTAALLAGKDPFDEPDLFEKPVDDDEDNDESDPEPAAELLQPDPGEPEALESESHQPQEDDLSEVPVSNPPDPPPSASLGNPEAQPASPAQSSAPPPAASASSPANPAPPQPAGPPAPWSPDNPITFSRRSRFPRR